MICNSCGKENADGAMFCAGCGAPLTQPGANVQPDAQNYQQPGMNAQPNVQNYQQPGMNAQPVQPVVNINTQPTVPADYEPISMWGYFGYEILFSIPCVGLICLIIFSFSSKNVNVKNFARSYFCYMIIVAVICVIVAIATGGIAALSSSY